MTLFKAISNPIFYTAKQRVFNSFISPWYSSRIVTTCWRLATHYYSFKQLGFHSCFCIYFCVCIFFSMEKEDTVFLSRVVPKNLESQFLSLLQRAREDPYSGCINVCANIGPSLHSWIIILSHLSKLPLSPPPPSSLSHHWGVKPQNFYQIELLLTFWLSIFSETRLPFPRFSLFLFPYGFLLFCFLWFSSPSFLSPPYQFLLLALLTCIPGTIGMQWAKVFKFSHLLNLRMLYTAILLSATLPETSW